jgi:endoglucanase
MSNPLPRWRGFNLLNFFQAFSRGEQSEGMVAEDDLRWTRDWGFDFIRLPMDYWFWIDTNWRKTRKLTPDDVMRISEKALEKVDRAVELCRKYKLHLSLNFHRAPGYCINERDSNREPFDLWKDKPAEDAFVHHWDVFAKRYKGISAKELSFNLVNEAPRPKEGRMTREDYRRVMLRATKAIRRTSPDRLVIVDGFAAGSMVVEGMLDDNVAQSVHAYHPGFISHYRAKWVDRSLSFPKPTWPLLKPDGSVRLDRAGLIKHYAPWGEIVRKGVGVHCGEAGCYSKTPHDVFLGWFGDVLEILKGHEIGWALWNLRGAFGVVDSGRTDIRYEDWKGRKLDRKLLALLQKS